MIHFIYIFEMTSFAISKFIHSLVYFLLKLRGDDIVLYCLCRMKYTDEKTFHIIIEAAIARFSLFLQFFKQTALKSE